MNRLNQVLGLVANNGRQKDLDEFNYWRRYRGEPEYTLQQWQASPYRTQAFTAADVQPLDPEVPAVLWRSPEVPRVPLQNVPLTGLNDLQQDFLLREFDSQNTANPYQLLRWRGTKMLGQGGFGRVGLWELDEPHLAPPDFGPTKVAVKESMLNPSSPRDSDLKLEKMWMEACGDAPSDHIVKQIAPPDYISEETIEPMSLFNGIIWRLYMEFCELGSIGTLLDRRISEQIPLSEATLWQLFDCLIDGATAMKWGGQEYEWNPQTQSFDLDTNYEPDAIHFDLKPGNVFLAERNERHPETPVAKVGDFGLAVSGAYGDTMIPEEEEDFMQSNRKKGTQTYYAPEQFTRRFDLAGWKTDPVVGKYSYKMNIWGMGIIMWQLATLSRKPPSAARPFVPNFVILGLLAAGVCYGADLAAYPNYTDRLKQTIFACLYEDPRLRPDLQRLKQLIRDGVTSCLLRNQPIDPWQSFLPYEPPPRVVRVPTQPRAPPAQAPPGQGPGPNAWGQVFPAQQVNPVIPVPQNVQVNPQIIPPPPGPMANWPPPPGRFRGWRSQGRPNTI